VLGNDGRFRLSVPTAGGGKYFRLRNRAATAGDSESQFNEGNEVETLSGTDLQTARLLAGH
ncbi:MAG TPA: hypothetical protein VHC44_00235, partial [Verrucomicrobiae bacterium]|nr:hypothetical protein [Verrucomicrobiae bacterium]